MADTKISAETAASALGGTELVEGVQSGANVKITAAQIKTFASASPTLVTPAIGVASGTSLALNGATLGTNKLAVTGTTLLTGAITGTSSLTLGTVSAGTGSINLANAASTNLTTIQAGNAAAAITYTWPANVGGAGTVLTDAAGNGTLSWGAIPSGTITSNSSLTSGFSAGQILYSDATKVQASAGLTTAANSLTIGTASSASGSLILLNSANAYTTTLQASASTAASRSYVWPVNFGASGSVLTDSAGNGVLSWATAPAAALTVGSTAISSGTTTRILYDNAGTLGEYTVTGSGTEVALSTSPVFITGITSPVATLGTQQTTQGSLVLANTAAGAYATTIKSSNSATGAVTLTLPPAVAAGSGYVLTDAAGNGTLSWAAVPAPAIGSVTGLGTGVATALAINVGTTGSFAPITTPTFITGITSPVATLGVQQTTQGSLVLANTAAGAFATTIKSSNSATAAVTYTLPTAGATVGGQVLTDAAANGVLSWATPASGALTIGTTSITSGTTTRLLYDLAGVVQEAAGVTVDPTSNGLVLTAPATAAASLLTLTGQTGVLAASQPVINATQTWNAASIEFSAIKTNITSTAALASSRIFDIQVGSAPVMILNKSGMITTGGAPTATMLTFSNGQSGITTKGGYGQWWNSAGDTWAVQIIGIINGNLAQGVGLASNMYIHFGSTTTWATATADTGIGRGGAAGTIQFGYADAAAPVAQTLQVQSVVAGTADGTAGKDWTLKASSGTGTGVGGNIIFKTPFSAKSSGTGQGTWVSRQIFVSKGKVLTSTAALSLVDIALPTLAMCGGQIEATIVCTDGTEMQSLTQIITFASVNKGGVYTDSITATTGDKTVTGGSTLTSAWSILDGTNKVTIQLTATTSLTPSANSFLVYFMIKNNSEQAITIL